MDIVSLGAILAAGEELTLQHESLGVCRVFLSSKLFNVETGRNEKQTTGISKQTFGRHHVFQAKLVRARDLVDVQKPRTRDALCVELLKRSPRGVGHEPTGVKE